MSDVKLTMAHHKRPFANYEARHFLWSVSNDAQGRPSIGTITLNRPDKKNPLTFDSYAELRDLFRGLVYATDIRTVVVTGAGGNFCSGGDVHEIIGPLTQMSMPELLDFTRMTGDLVKAMRACPQPIVSAIDGICAGAGAMVALASDMRLGTPQTKTAFLFVRGAEVDPGRGEVRREFARALQQRQRLGDRSVLQQRGAEMMQHQRIVGLQPQRPAQQRERLGALAAQVMDRRLQAQRLGMVRCRREHAAQRLFCLVDPMRGQVATGLAQQAQRLAVEPGETGLGIDAVQAASGAEIGRGRERGHGFAWSGTAGPTRIAEASRRLRPTRLPLATLASSTRSTGASALADLAVPRTLSAPEA